MKKSTSNNTFPFVVPCPKDMKPLEQVMCMVYLAQNCSLSELRNRQVFDVSEKWDSTP